LTPIDVRRDIDTLLLELRAMTQTRLAFCVTTLLLAGCATAPTEKANRRDPFERVNRSMYTFNERIDRSFAKPLAKAYRAVVPQVVRTGVGNFLGNLDYPTTIINAALQGKLRQSGRDSARFLLNTTLGLGGIFDPATAAGFEANDEDFGQTLGTWGVPAGPYLMLPIFGPSTMRDTPTRLVDRATTPVQYVEETAINLGVSALSLLDGRAALLDLDSQLTKTYDPYAFLRNAWLQRREYKVRDGEVPEDESLELEPEVPEEPMADPGEDSEVAQPEEPTATP
jgi:phospholipid-binding lipoprotein MlaA